MPDHIFLWKTWPYFKGTQEYYPELKVHLESTQKKNLTYLSATSQNEMNEVIGKKIVLKEIIKGKIT